VGLSASPMDLTSPSVEKMAAARSSRELRWIVVSGEWTKFAALTSYLVTSSTIHSPYYYSCQN